MLSLAGRVCLVNSVIVSSLTHSMMIYRWPRSHLKSMDNAMRNLFGSKMLIRLIMVQLHGLGFVPLMKKVVLEYALLEWLMKGFYINLPGS